MKTIGILGGMGPQATADLYMKIIHIFQEKYNAVYDSDFPHIIINSIPLPDIVENRGDTDAMLKMLKEGCVMLEREGADFIMIPCNSVSTFIPEMRAVVQIPIFSIIEKTINRLRKRVIGIVATEYTIRNRLYDLPIQKQGRICIIPRQEEQAILTEIILDILANKRLQESKRKLDAVIGSLKQRGAEEVILGCTELPLLAEKDDTLIDTLQVLAEEAVAYCRS